MAPPGVNTFNDMTIYSVCVCTPFSTALKSKSFLSPKSMISSELVSIMSDHDYFMKPQDNYIGYSTIMASGYSDFTDCECSGGDEMLNSCAADSQNVTMEDGNTDFLKDLEDLDFGLDIDPNCDVEMDDSFQEFIDSALEKSSPSFMCDNFTGHNKQQCDQDAEFFQKEEFLTTLDLRPVQADIGRNEQWSPSFTSVTPGSGLCSTNYLNDTLSDSISPAPTSKDTPSFDVIPTKKCSCLGSDNAPKAVYSTAHGSHQDCVRICPSTLVTSANDSGCTNCTRDRLTSKRLMSPLFIDTSLSRCSESFQPITDDHLHVSVDNNMLSEVNRDTTDVIQWLTENEQSNQQQGSVSNNSITERREDRVATFTETLSQINSADLESFIDLEDFLNAAEDKNTAQTTFDHSCERIADLSKFKAKDAQCNSQLKHSFLEELPEHMGDSDIFRLDSHLDLHCDGYSQGSQTPTSSNLSYCGSPEWSLTVSAQPSPLGSMDFSLPTENTFEESSLKSQLALLNLFSEENVEFLLLTDSAVPSARFV